MLGDFYLRFLQDFLEMTDTKRSLAEEMEKTQPGRIGQTLMNLGKSHLPNDNR